jgi:putative hydrolase of the HAD superfamily
VRIDAVLFDWGGTLTPFHDVDLLDLWRVAAQVLAPDRVDEVATALLAAEDEVWAEVRATCRSATTEQVIARASERSGLDVEEAVHGAALAAYLDSWTSHTHARPDAAEVLMSLREQGLRTGMLSNTHWPREWHERWLERDGLIELLDARVYTCELTHVKPHRVAFEALVDAVDVDPTRSVFVGDRQVDDIGGAHAMGMRTVHIPSGLSPGGEVEADAVITELAELLAVVEGWRR